MGLTEVVIVGKDPQAVHLHCSVAGDGNGLTSVFLEAMPDQPIDEVDRKQRVFRGSRRGGGGSTMDDWGVKREVGQSEIACEQAWIEGVPIGVNGQRLTGDGEAGQLVNKQADRIAQASFWKGESAFARGNASSLGVGVATATIGDGVGDCQYQLAIGVNERMQVGGVVRRGNATEQCVERHATRAWCGAQQGDLRAHRLATKSKECLRNSCAGTVLTPGDVAQTRASTKAQEDVIEVEPTLGEVVDRLALVAEACATAATSVALDRAATMRVVPAVANLPARTRTDEVAASWICAVGGSCHLILLRQIRWFRFTSPRFCTLRIE